MQTKRRISFWRATQVLIVVIALGWITISLYITIRDGRTGFGSKSLWDWLDLLIVPIFLAIGVWWLRRNEQIAERKAEDRRQKIERDILVNNQNQEMLGEYLDRITSLLLENDLKKSDDYDSIRGIARARTLTVLSVLDKVRKTQVVHFLIELGLVGVEGFINIQGCDLAETDLRGVDFRGINLSGANLSGADLSEANLDEANLFGANLSQTIMINTSLNKAFMQSSSLREALLAGASLKEAVIKRVDLNRADLTGANLIRADLRGSDLRDTRLSWANFENALMGWVDMSGSTIRGASFEGADFNKAYLIGVDMTDSQITTQQLRDMKTFETSILPNGKEYQDWIEDVKWEPTDVGPDAEIIEVT